MSNAEINLTAYRRKGLLDFEKDPTKRASGEASAEAYLAFWKHLHSLPDKMQNKKPVMVNGTPVYLFDDETVSPLSPSPENEDAYIVYPEITPRWTR